MEGRLARLAQSLAASGAPAGEWRTQLVVGLRDAIECESALLAPVGRPAVLLGKEGYEHMFAQHLRSPERYGPTLAALRVGALRGGGACVDTLALSRRARARSPFYAEPIAAQGIRSQVFAATELRGRPLWTLFLCRHGRGRPFAREDAEALARVLPVLGALQVAVEWAGAATDLDVLSPREREIAALVARGLRTREIAAVFGTSPNTVRNQIVKIFTKAGVTTRAELAARAAGRPDNDR
jgi:DNA-binding CsgD family transcriptional regulator